MAGCMGSPTYGTDKTANAQLMEDLSGAFAIGIGKRREQIDYQPRPDLVKPQTTAVLPPPQDNVTNSAAAGWPESPEQRLARIRREATENQDNLAYRSPVINDVVVDGRTLSPGEQREEFRRRLAETRSLDPNRRRNLSDPPLDYRVPAATAPAGELGETEERKQRAAEREARKNSKNKNRGAVAEAPLTRY